MKVRKKLYKYVKQNNTFLLQCPSHHLVIPCISPAEVYLSRTLHAKQY